MLLQINSYSAKTTKLAEDVKTYSGADIKSNHTPHRNDQNKTKENNSQEQQFKTTQRRTNKTIDYGSIELEIRNYRKYEQNMLDERREAYKNIARKINKEIKMDENKRFAEQCTEIK